MNAYTNLWKPTGLMLIHSLWQALLILLIVYGIIRLFKIEKASTKYNLCLAGLFVFALAAVVTFINCWSGLGGSHHKIMSFTLLFKSEILIKPQNTLRSLVYQYLPWLVSGWFIGVILLTIRLIGGFYYLHLIKSKTIAKVDPVWLEKIEQLKIRLQIKQSIKVKLSQAIHSPMVMGVFKPIIFLPITLFSGLSDEQIETIISHELAHIKRHDFIINILQHVVETLFFFNPFVWILSGLIRKEREHACDDLALPPGADTVAYVRALVQLQQVELQPQLALHFATNNNNLLNRIKRLTGMKTQKFIEARVLALVLLAAVLMSFGWYSFQQQKDTTKAEQKMAQNPKAEVVVIEEALPEKEEINDAPSVAVLADTVPAVESPPPPIPNWDEAFAEKFKAQFGDFYAQNQKAIEKMMDEARAEQMERTAALEHYMQLHQKDMSKEQLIKAKQQLDLEQAERERHHQLRTLELQHHEKARQQEMMAREMALDQERLQRQSLELQQKSEAMQEEMQAKEKELAIEQERLRKLEKEMRVFQEEITKALIEDGYLKSGEEIRSLTFNKDEYKVNGKEIKKKDAAKYEKLYKKHFGESPDGFRIEH